LLLASLGLGNMLFLVLQHPQIMVEIVILLVRVWLLDMAVVEVLAVLIVQMVALVVQEETHIVQVLVVVLADIQGLAVMAWLGLLAIAVQRVLVEAVEVALCAPLKVLEVVQ
jgi:hypothetical protein